MNRIVVDASLAGAWLLPDEHSPEADRWLRAVMSDSVRLVAPEIWTYEMLNLLVAAHRRKRITEEQVGEAGRLLQSVPVLFYDHATALSRERMTALAMRFGLSAYDAAYLELADRLQCPLYTADAALARAAATLGLTPPRPRR